MYIDEKNFTPTTFSYYYNNYLFFFRIFKRLSQNYNKEIILIVS